MLAGYCRVEQIEVREDQDVERRIPDRAYVVAARPRGPRADSVAFAKWLDERRLAARDVCFVIGGPVRAPRSRASTSGCRSGRSRCRTSSPASCCSSSSTGGTRSSPGSPTITDSVSTPTSLRSWARGSSRAVKAAVDSDISVDAGARRARRRPGAAWDYQSNAAMGLAKRLGVAVARAGGADRRPPRRRGRLGGAERRGPGLPELPAARRPGSRPGWRGCATDERLGVEPAAEPRRVVVDYSAPNVAKEMHVGHLRSDDHRRRAGPAAARSRATRSIPQNHLGDWGTPFGMLIEHMLDEGWTEGASEHSIADLNAFYQAARDEVRRRPGVRRARRARRVVALQGGDPATLELWRRLRRGVRAPLRRRLRAARRRC